MLTGKIYAPTLNNKIHYRQRCQRFISRYRVAVIRPIILQGMKIIGKQFVMGTTIEEALKRAQKLSKQRLSLFIRYVR